MTSMGSSKGDYLFLKYLEKFREVRSHHLNTLKTKWIRSSIIVLAHLCNVDVCAKAKGKRVDREPRKWWRPQLFGLKYIERSDWWRGQKYTWLTGVISVIYWLSSFYLVLNMHYQYSLDFDKLRLRRLQSMLKQGLVTQPDFQRPVTTLLDRIAGTTLTLRAMGAPHRHMSIIIQSLYLYIVLFSFILYYACHLFYRTITPFDFHFVRDLLETEVEQRHSEATVQHQMIRFIESSRVFSELHQSSQLKWSSFSASTAEGRGSCSTNQPHGLMASSQWPVHKAREGGASISQVSTALSQEQCQATLTRMHQIGALRPHNKSLESFKRCNKHLFISIGSLTVFCTVFFSTIVAASLSRRDTSSALSWPDLVNLGALFALILLIVGSGTLTGALFSVSSLDQAAMVDKMRELILRCIANNRHEFQQLNERKALCSLIGHASDASEERKLSKQLEIGIRLNAHKMNANFLFIFMQYKIFIAHYQTAQRAFQVAMVLATFMMLVISIIIRLHLPYLAAFNFHNIKWFATGMSLASLLPVNFVLLPICYLDARFINLYRIFSSLIAHVTEVESHPNGNGIHDKHAVSLLLKEMRCASQFKDRSNTGVAGMAATYTTLVKAHFWLGIIALSILLDNQDFSDTSQLSNTFTSDPFGVFSHPKWLGIE